jgi:NAD(P)-dependent dehydrogenase (short-subunit alcohol dehydrogenase family)
MKNLNEKTVLITGGGGLLGTEHGFACAAAGAAVVLVDIVEERLQDARASILARVPEAVIHTRICDITSEDAVAGLKADLDAGVGFVECLVNNAAVNSTPVKSKNIADQEEKHSGDFATLPLALWDREIAVGLTGAFLMCRAFGPSMAEQKRGSIVNISSDLAVIAPDHKIYEDVTDMEDVTVFKAATYSVVKTGLVGLTRYLATFWAHRGVRCNALVPGGVWNGHDEAFTSRQAARAPLNRMAYKDDFYDAIVFLCADGSSYMNGHVMVMDGGRTIW